MGTPYVQDKLVGGSRANCIYALTGMAQKGSGTDQYWTNIGPILDLPFRGIGVMHRGDAMHHPDASHHHPEVTK